MGLGLALTTLIALIIGSLALLSGASVEIGLIQIDSPEGTTGWVSALVALVAPALLLAAVPISATITMWRESARIRPHQVRDLADIASPDLRSVVETATREHEALVRSFPGRQESV